MRPKVLFHARNVCFLLFAVQIKSAVATDYFLTIGGGYQPSANQASLEANVLFFQQVLTEEHRGPRTQATFFADGNDSELDLQVLSKSVSTSASDLQTPVTNLLTSLTTFRGGNEVEYRNHSIANVSGANDPQSIRGTLQHFAKSMTAGDRLIVYVTAHGSEAKGRNKFNTTISCWDKQSISVREFAVWLDAVPDAVPVVMVMAQCYCGGFSHSIFENANRSDGLSNKFRVGFFAQQHDLAAAGCRPDIENEEEFSSYFWGAFVGRSRNGKPMVSADYDENGRISFAEAHAHALLTSETIDIPLRSSEALLRSYSVIDDYDHLRSDDQDVRASLEEKVLAKEGLPLAAMAGSLKELSHDAAPELRQTVVGLAQQLGIDLEAEVSEVFGRFDEERVARSQQRRESFRGRRRGSSGRRELREEIVRQWPELGESDWKTSEVLREPGQKSLLEEIEKLPSYARFVEGQRNREFASDAAERSELREVKFQRLINTLEAIVLAKNIAKVADVDVVKKYEQMLAIERSYLSLRPK